MPAVASPAKTDPLKAFMAGAFVSHSEKPMPLLSTSFDVTIEAGLAMVVTKRRFRNDEEESIEATITFPIPVHATLFSLEAQIDRRVLRAHAQRRAAARDTYEGALKKGKSAVLHEEVLRGVHMLSVGHIPPGGEIEVTTSWAMTLSIVNNRGCLRIPLTVGDIYGRSGLSGSDDLTHGGPNQNAELMVRCGNGTIVVKDQRLNEGRATVPLNRPIDLDVIDWTPRDLHGRAADGREVVLRVEPQEAKDSALSAAVLVDRSGSMAEACDAGQPQTTKHQAVIKALTAVAKQLGDRDVVDLWEFNTSVNRVEQRAPSRRTALLSKRRKASPHTALLGLIGHMQAPSGGTDIGTALGDVIEQSQGRDLLLVTDGKSYALDVQALAAFGRRIAVVLVGEDSLEANVGHLAALTGGDIFVATSADLQHVLVAAIEALRQRHERPRRMKSGFRHIEAARGNAILSAEWRKTKGQPKVTDLGRAVAAVSANIALPALPVEAATKLAEAEGLVTHLTSLVLVDEEGVVQEGVPATRKIDLPSPLSFMSDLGWDEHVSAPIMRGGVFQRREAPLPSFRIGTIMADLDQSGDMIDDLRLVRSGIDWASSPKKLIAGDLSSLDGGIVEAIERSAKAQEVVTLAHKLKVSPLILVIGLLAHSVATTNRSAARIADAIFGKRRGPELLHVCNRLGL